MGIYDFANIFYRFIINSTSSLYGIDGDAPFLVTVIADAQAQMMAEAEAEYSEQEEELDAETAEEEAEMDEE